MKSHPATPPPVDPTGFDDHDPIGAATLDAVAEADKFTRWMHDTIRPWCKGRILEIGSGMGNMSRWFVEEGADLVMSDLREAYLAQLRVKFPGKQCMRIDLVDPQFETKFAQLLGTFDTVFALNVVEHIKDDKLALENCRKLLRPGGHLVILVPAYQALYNGFDEGLGHFRRYTRKSLNTVMQNAGMTLLHHQYFNLAGILGWYVSGKMMKKQSIPKDQMKLYNLLVPVFKVVDKVTFNRMGLSVISVGRK